MLLAGKGGRVPRGVLRSGSKGLFDKALRRQKHAF